MTSLTEHQHTTSEQHEELGKNRIQRDFRDLQKISDWFEINNPFDIKRINLQSLPLGLVSDESISCDNAEEVGRKIQMKLDGISVSKASIKPSDQIKSFWGLRNAVKINKQVSVLILLSYLQDL